MSSAALDAYLASCDKNYETAARLMGQSHRSPGYHSRVPDGQWVHPVRENFQYARRLLERARMEDVARACTLLDRLLPLQETDPVQATYGVWPWLAEEPLAQMSPPDWNWADFCGALIAEILIHSRTQLPADMQARLHAALSHAARSIFRRNVQPGYTNIAIMGGCVTAAAGEILGESWLLDYGRRRLQTCVAHFDYHGGFNEFNSPAYTIVALEECERVLNLVRDEPTRAAAETLRGHAWRIIAEHFHAPSRQWAGPHARTYSNVLTEAQRRFLAERTGVTLTDKPLPSQGVPCPAELIPLFRDPPTAAVERRQRFIRHATDDECSVYGTTWLAPHACLGTVNHGDTWTQRRTLVGYWPVAGPTAACLRTHFLREGRDFASGMMFTRQREHRFLTALNLATNLGDWHIHLDRPAAGTFCVTDLRWRFLLLSPGAQATALDNGRYRLTAGNVATILHTLPGRFGNWDVRYELGGDAAGVWLDAVCYHGEAVMLDPKDIGPITLALAGEILPAEAAPTTTPPCRLTATESRQQWQWEGLTLTAPLRPAPAI